MPTYMFRETVAETDGDLASFALKKASPLGDRLRIFVLAKPSAISKS
jgi:hypothetical protein